jgi:hypothetical protein
MERHPLAESVCEERTGYVSGLFNIALILNFITAVVKNFIAG